MLSFSRQRILARAFSQRRSASVWAGVPLGPEDPIFGVTTAFEKDKNPKKIHLGVGAYRDDNGLPYVLDCVKEAEKRVLASSARNHEYAGIAGVPAFVRAATKLALADTYVEEKIAAVQVLSGTGALRVGADFLRRFLPNGTKVYLSNPTWANHNPIFQDAGLQTAQYTYYNPANCGLNIEGLLKDIKAAPKRSVFLLHACAHNPTGVDPSLEQWGQISEAIKIGEHFPFFDLAYQGFASGDPDKDAAAVRYFVKNGHQIALCQSFAKNFGLYGQRAGAFSLTTTDAAETERLMSQLKILIRPMYSNPPIHGAQIVSTVLNDKELYKQWLVEVAKMAKRLIGVRETLEKKLKEKGSTRNWRHVTDQIGMFCYSGLTADQVEKLAKEYSIYMTKNGRISLTGVTTKNVDYLAEGIHNVTK